METLPPELLDRILSYAVYPKLACLLACAQVSHEWKDVCYGLKDVVHNVYIGYIGEIKTAKRAIRYGCKWRCDVLATYAIFGRLNGLRLIYETGGGEGNLESFTRYGVMRDVVIYGRYDNMRFLFDHGWPLDDMCWRAAYHGHLKCLKFMHSIGLMTKSSLMCECAADGGNVKCLKYAHRNGCKLCYGVIFNAKNGFTNGHKKCLAYAKKNHCPTDWIYPQVPMPTSITR